jgi:putative membrane protein
MSTHLRAQAEHDADPRLDLAVERTELALERTHLAWVRTVLSMIGGGFAIDKGLGALHDARVAAGKALIQNSHAAGMIFTVTGTVLMALEMVYYIKRARELARMKSQRFGWFSPDLIIAWAIIFIGCMLTAMMQFT